MIVDLARIPKAGVYLLLDDESRNFYVGYTVDMGSALARVYEMAARLPALGFCMLTEGDDLVSLKLHTEYYRNMYLGVGYKEIMAPGRKSLQYRVRVVVAPDYRNIDVELVTARGLSKVVGRFRTKAEAQDFVMYSYGEDNPYRLPVYATNSLTREVLAQDGKPTIVL